MSSTIKIKAPPEIQPECLGFDRYDDDIWGFTDRQLAARDAQWQEMVGALVEAVEAAIACGMVPVSSAKEGGAARYSQQVRVADSIRAALSAITEE